MTEHETNLRDLAAMFAMAALIARDKYNDVLPHKEAFRQADLFMKQRAKEDAVPELLPEDGIAAIKPKRKKTNEQD